MNSPMASNKASLAPFARAFCIATLIAAMCSTGVQSADVITCVGNSTTQYTYPNKLQALLGDAYDVKDLGASGMCALTDAYAPDSSYWQTSDGHFSRALASNPSIVIIMLGANDSKPHHWEHKEHFAPDFALLAKTLKLAPQSKPKVYLCRTMPAFENGHGIQGDVIENEIVPIIDSIAQADGYTTIDCFGAFKDRPELLGDGVHPNDEGKTVLARTIYDCIVSGNCHYVPVQTARRALSKGNVRMSATKKAACFDIRGKHLKSGANVSSQAPMVMFSPTLKRLILAD
jgi:acyl-CoA thioesterase I